MTTLVLCLWLAGVVLAVTFRVVVVRKARRRNAARRSTPADRGGPAPGEPTAPAPSEESDAEGRA